MSTSRHGAVILEALRAHVVGENHLWLPPALHPEDQPRSSAPGALAAYAHHHRDAIVAWLDEVLVVVQPSGAWLDNPAHHLALYVLRRVQAVNQYIELEPAYVAALDDLASAALSRVARALEDTASEAALVMRIEQAWEEWARGIAGWLEDLLAQQPPGLARPSERSVVCAEYDPDLQCHLLGIEPVDLLQPVLDLGCGQHAGLVRALRARGLAVAGVDRVAAPLDGVTEGDWMTFPLRAGEWGTIISHLAFSLHFLHHHLRPGESDAERYATRYMALLGALRPGGAFVYAPGLPFLERLLPKDRFRVERRAIHAPSPGDSGYACRVERVDA